MCATAGVTPGASTWDCAGIAALATDKAAGIGCALLNRRGNIAEEDL